MLALHVSFVFEAHLQAVGQGSCTHATSVLHARRHRLAACGYFVRRRLQEDVESQVQRIHRQGQGVLSAERLWRMDSDQAHVQDRRQEDWALSVV